MWNNNRLMTEDIGGNGNTGAISAPPSRVFHIHNSIEAIVSIWAAKCRKNSTSITSVYAENLPQTLPFESLSIQQSINNLVSNAVRFTKNGSIQLSISHYKAKGRSYIAFSVIDSGCGISPNKTPHLFKARPAYTQSKPKYGVVEASLSATNKLITDVGGQILYKTKPDIGSVFSILLPYNSKVTNEYSYDSNLIVNTQYEKYNDLKILIVDDYNLNQVTIKTLLYDVTDKLYYASNGYEAIDVLYSCPIDLVLMDIHMPGMDGIDATMRIRESKQSWSNIFIAALSADPQYQLTHLCKKIGMDAALAKPIRKREILKLLDEYLSVSA